MIDAIITSLAIIAAALLFNLMSSRTKHDTVDRQAAYREIGKRQINGG